MSLRGVATRNFGVLVAAIVGIGFVLRLSALIAMRDDAISPDGFYYSLAANLFAEGEGWPNPLALALGTVTPAANHPPAWSVLLSGGSILGFDARFDHQVIAVLVGTSTVAAVSVRGPQDRWCVGRARRSSYHGRLSEPVDLRARAPCRTPRVPPRGARHLAGVRVPRPSDRAQGHRHSEHCARCWRIDESGAGAALRVALPARRSSSRTPERRADRIRWLTVGGVTFALILSPWIVYNNMRFDEPVTLTTNMGETMRIGNCPSTYSGPLLGSFDPDCRQVLTPGDPSVERCRKTPPSHRIRTRPSHAPPGSRCSARGRGHSVSTRRCSSRDSTRRGASTPAEQLRCG